MALKKSEKKMLKILAGVAIVSGIFLYRAYAPREEDQIEQLEPTDKKEENKTSPSTARRGGGSSGRSSSGGGGAKNPETTISNVEFQNHSTGENCWVLIDGLVFDITPFIVAYPFVSEEVNQYCGTFGFEEGYLKNNLEYKDSVSKAATKKGVIR